jgi:hypothetical protein
MPLHGCWRSTMRGMLKTVLIIATMAWLAGCASTPDDSGYASRGDTTKARRNQYDSVYISRVEAAAARRGVDVRWVHLPRKPER